MSSYKMCAVCGRTATCEHHLIFGYGKRPLCDKDKLVLDLCDYCHNMGNQAIHGNASAETLSKMLGQALWEQKAIDRVFETFDVDLVKYAHEEARQAFRERYGRSWL